MVNDLVLGKPRKDSKRIYVTPDAAARLHRSLTGLWWLLEVLPKPTRWREWPRRPSLLGFYLPLAEPRPIWEGAAIHGSVFERMETEPNYRPVNLPQKSTRVG